MSKLLKKEFSLAIHPTNIIFVFMAFMLFIPNYPYLVVYFFTTLGIFFTCLNGRENKDIQYMMLLPVCKKDIVKARFLMAFILEMAVIIASLIIVFIKSKTITLVNAVGMEANIALIGFGFMLFGMFNIIFLQEYYKDVNKVGVSFFKASVVTFLFVGIIETLSHVVPLFKDKLDTIDPQFMSSKIVVLIIGIAIYLILTYIAYVVSLKRFIKYDIDL